MIRLFALSTMLLLAAPAIAQERHSDLVGSPAIDQKTDLGKAMTICAQFTIPMFVKSPRTEIRAYRYDGDHWKRCDAIHGAWEKQYDAPAHAAKAAQKAADEKLLDTISGVKK